MRSARKISQLDTSKCNPSEIERIKRVNHQVEKWEIEEIKPSSPKEEHKNCYEASFSNTDERFIYDAKTGKLKTQTNDDKSNEIRRHKNTLLELEKEREYNEKLLTHAEICEESKCPDKRNYEKIKKRVAELDRKINYHKDNQARPVKFVVDNEKSPKLPEKTSNEGERQTLIINLK
ncbi:4218_t:CDS:2, partial [Ambispora leptoticha]